MVTPDYSFGWLDHENVGDFCVRGSAWHGYYARLLCCESEDMAVPDKKRRRKEKEKPEEKVPSFPRLWQYRPDNAKPIAVRETGEHAATLTGFRMQPGTVFEVDLIRRSVDGYCFLRLANGDGWVFDRSPRGNMCFAISDTPAARGSMGAASHPRDRGLRTGPAEDLDGGAAAVGPSAPAGRRGPSRRSQMPAAPRQ